MPRWLAQLPGIRRLVFIHRRNKDVVARANISTGRARQVIEDYRRMQKEVER